MPKEKIDGRIGSLAGQWKASQDCLDVLQLWHRSSLNECFDRDFLGPWEVQSSVGQVDVG